MAKSPRGPSAMRAHDDDLFEEESMYIVTTSASATARHVPSERGRSRQPVPFPACTRSARGLLLARCLGTAAVAMALLGPALAQAHGDVAPQPVNTKGLKPLGKEWHKTNPYRGDVRAAEIGKSAYNQQCARCHGLEGVSGGLAPDLRFLERGAEGDKAFLPPTRRGVSRDGRTMMPKYEGVMSQEGMWAIRTWLETVNEQ